jgi:multiple sugar transport system substrate-binding protein
MEALVSEITRRDFVKLTGGLGAAGLLAACGLGGSASTTTATGSGSGVSTTAAGSGGSTGANPKDLSLWIVDHDGAVRDVLENQIIPSFVDANPGYRVSPRYSGWERYAEEVTTAFTGSVGPDVYQGGAVWVGQQVDRGWALPLTPYVDQATGWDWEDFSPGSRDDVTVGDDIFAVPYRISPQTLWYRSDVLGEEGFNTPPTTWDELRTVANATVRRDAGGAITREGFDTNLGGGPDWQAEMQRYWDFMYQAGGRFLSDDLSRCTLDEDPAVEALQFMYSLIVEDGVMPYPSFENQGELSALELGLTATATFVELPDLRVREYAPDQADFVKAAAPLSSDEQGTHIYVNKYFVSAESKDPEGSWLLLQHLTSRENLEAYASASSYLTPRASLAGADYLSDNLKTLASAGEKYGIPYPRHPNLLELFRPFSENLDRCFRGQQTPVETMRQTVEAVNALL